MGKKGLVYFGRLAVLVILYVVAGKFGLWLAATGGGYAAPVWPPTGIAAAALILWGPRYAPGVWVGAFIVNFLIRSNVDPANFLIATMIGCGNTLEALLIAYYLKSVTKFSPAFRQMSDVKAFLTAALIIPVVSASIGVGSLVAVLRSGYIGNAYEAWLTWWIGDMLGALIILPLILSFFEKSAQGSGARVGRFDRIPVLPVLVFSGLAVFCWFVPVAMRELFISFLVYSALVWCAMELGTRGLFLSVTLVSAIAIAGAYGGHGPFSLESNIVKRLFLLQLYLGCMSTTMIILRALLSEKLAASELARTREVALVASEKLSLLGVVTSGIAHEINNPLSVIYGKATMAKAALQADKLDTEVVAKSLEKIESMAARIEKIIDSVRFISRTRDSDPFEVASLKTIVEDTLELCSDHFRKDGVQLVIEPLPHGLELECRPVQVAQVLLNLLTNAQAAASDSAERWVRLSARLAGDSVELSVVDSGHGIPAEEQSEIFRPFFTTKKSGKGTGLGLSLSKSIVSQHGGTIALDTSSTHTRFVVSFPLKARGV